MDNAGYFTTPTPTPFPNFVAHNAVEAEQIQMLHQIQNHTLSAKQMYLFIVSQAFPFNFFPPEIKMSIYHVLLSGPLHSRFDKTPLT